MLDRTLTNIKYIFCCCFVQNSDNSDNESTKNEDLELQFFPRANNQHILYKKDFDFLTPIKHLQIKNPLCCEYFKFYDIDTNYVNKLLHYANILKQEIIAFFSHKNLHCSADQINKFLTIAVSDVIRCLIKNNTTNSITKSINTFFNKIHIQQNDGNNKWYSYAFKLFLLMIIFIVSNSQKQPDIINQVVNYQEVTLLQNAMYFYNQGYINELRLIALDLYHKINTKHTNVINFKDNYFPFNTPLRRNSK